MIELKAYKGDVTIPVYGTISDTEVYLKKDVDTVIAEKDKEIAELESENESLLQQNRELCQALQVMYSKEEYDKQRYKRCLAMANWCASEAYIHEYGSEYDEDLVAWFGKWHKRWLELAEKFKEAK